MKDQNGSLGIEQYISLLFVMFATFILMCGLAGAIALGSATNDANNLGNSLIAPRYRDQGCLTPETVTTAKNMMVIAKMPPGSVTIEGLSSDPVEYGTASILLMKYNYHFTGPGMSWMNLHVEIPVPIPVYSQYSPQLGSPTPTCVVNGNL